ncbi:hypothetical protein LOZ65_002750 [Ophidiomyces ophidiicola]|nr:hypothetical protein LOZ65_002750 [Ophidiomyces ophidiicola]
MENISDVDIRIARVEELIHAQTDQLQASQFRQVGSLYGYKQNRQIRRTAYPGSNFALHPEGLTGFTLLHYLSTQLFLADPNITDTQLSGPISNAAARGHTVCVRLLLEAGGDPDPPLPSGVRIGSPLIIATRNAADTMSLLDFGANVNSRGSDG